jgi:hypothetical protein
VQKNQGAKRKLTEGFRSAGGRRRGAGDDGGGGARTETGGARGEGGGGRSLSVGFPRIDTRRSCEGARGIRDVRGSPATKNCGGGTAHRRRSLREISMMQRLGVGLRGSESF